MNHKNLVGTILAVMMLAACANNSNSMSSNSAFPDNLVEDVITESTTSEDVVSENTIKADNDKNEIGNDDVDLTYSRAFIFNMKNSMYYGYSNLLKQIQFDYTGDVAVIQSFENDTDTVSFFGYGIPTSYVLTGPDGGFSLKYAFCGSDLTLTKTAIAGRDTILMLDGVSNYDMRRSKAIKSETIWTNTSATLVMNILHDIHYSVTVCQIATGLYFVSTRLDADEAYKAGYMLKSTVVGDYYDGIVSAFISTAYLQYLIG
jgi:hypothetical protein